jgi:uncharacterized membrane protein
VHPALSDFPMVFLSVAVLVDVVALVSGNRFWWMVSFGTVVAGLVAAVPTAAAGLIDYGTSPEGQPALRTGTIHMVLMLTAVACFGIELLLRGTSVPQGALLLSTVGLDALGAGILVMGGWFGGELVFGHGLGVRRSRGTSQIPESNPAVSPSPRRPTDDPG